MFAPNQINTSVFRPIRASALKVGWGCETLLNLSLGETILVILFASLEKQRVTDYCSGKCFRENFCRSGAASDPTRSYQILKRCKTNNTREPLRSILCACTAAAQPAPVSIYLHYSLNHRLSWPCVPQCVGLGGGHHIIPISYRGRGFVILYHIIEDL